MGGSVSKQSTTVDILNSTSIGLDQTTMNNIQNTCANNTNQKNVLNIIGSNVTKLSTNQKNIAKNICILQTAIETVKDADASNKMMSALKSAIDQSSTAGIGVAVNTSDTNVRQTNVFAANVSQTDINNAITGCINQLDQSNVMNIIGSNVTDSDFSQSNDSFTKCLSSYGVTSKQKATTASDQSAVAETSTTQTAKGMDPLASLASMFGAYTNLILGIIALIIVSSLGSSLMSSMGGMGGGGGGDGGGGSE